MPFIPGAASASTRTTTASPGRGPARALWRSVAKAMRERNLLFLGLCAVLSGVPAGAQADDFYKDKTITLVIGVSPGGAADGYARLLARYMGHHLTGEPDIIVQNLPGSAGHILAARCLELTAPHDGTAMAYLPGGLATQAMLDRETISIDFGKIAFIGSITDEVSVCYTWQTLGVNRWEDLFKQELKLPALSKTSYSYQTAAVLKNMFKMPVNLVVGYPGSAEQNVAVEAGELNAKCGAWASVPKDWLAENKIRLFARFSELTAPGMPEGLPFIGDLAKTDGDRQVIDFIFAPQNAGRPYAVARDVPAERLTELRAAFDATMKDPAFLAEAEKLKFSVNPLTGEQVDDIVGRVLAASPELLKKVSAALE
jgi:tripartite-type tricarboxylate transporter receptor subunit TctC